MLLGMAVAIAAGWLAAANDVAPADPSADPSADPPVDLSGVWRVEVEARTTSSALLCRALPVLRETLLDTVAAAGSLEELVRALLPADLVPTYDRLCWHELHAPGERERERIDIGCRVPAVLVAPCSLTVDFLLTGNLVHPDSVIGYGVGKAFLSGPGLCPDATCPGEIHVRAAREQESRSGPPAVPSPPPPPAPGEGAPGGR